MSEKQSGEKSTIRPAVHSPKKQINPVVASVRKVCAWVTITSATVFAFIAILSIWGAFGDSGAVVGKAFASLSVIGFSALIVGLVSLLLND